MFSQYCTDISDLVVRAFQGWVPGSEVSSLEILDKASNESSQSCAILLLQIVFLTILQGHWNVGSMFYTLAL